MKKLILFLLIATLLILPLSGCFADNQQNEETTPANTTENTTPESTTPEVTTPEATTPEVTTPDNPLVDTPTYDRSQELNEVFTLIEQDKLANNKISLCIIDEDLHFELKKAGYYNDEEWCCSYIAIVVYCEYETAVNETWYKPTSQSDKQSLNQALYDYYGLNGKFSNILGFEGLYILYNTSLDEFLADYSIIKSFAKSGYVTSILISYQYSLPKSYWVDDY